MRPHHLVWCVDAVLDDWDEDPPTPPLKWFACVIPCYHFDDDNSYYTKNTEFYLHLTDAGVPPHENDYMRFDSPEEAKAAARNYVQKQYNPEYPIEEY